MARIGRRNGRTPLGRPNNRGLFPRANAQLEAQAGFQAERYNNSLKVDGPAFYFWHRNKGSVPCSCQAAPGRGFHADFEPGEPNALNSSVVGDDLDSEFDDLDSTDTGAPNLDSLFGSLNSDPAYQRHRNNVHSKLTDSAEAFEGVDDSDLEDDNEPRPTAIDSSDPLNLFSARVIDCPVCLGSGYIDSYQLQGGQRFVFDTSNVYNFSAHGVDINERENPTELVAHPRTRVSWMLTFPKVWTQVLKVGVFDGVTPVDPATYRWRWSNGALSGVVTPDALEELNGVGGTVTLRLEFDTEVTLTHAELVFAYREPFRAQIPEIAQGYEREFLDWSVTTNAELPTDARVGEGDYLTEAKYARVWKIGVLTPRVTAGGQVFGQTVELRALQQFEKKAEQLALFGAPGTVRTTPNSGVYGGSGTTNVIDYKWDQNEW